MWRNDTKCKHLFMFPLKNLARKVKGLTYVTRNRLNKRCLLDTLPHSEMSIEYIHLIKIPPFIFLLNQSNHNDICLETDVLKWYIQTSNQTGLPKPIAMTFLSQWKLNFNIFSGTEHFVIYKAGRMISVDAVLWMTVCDTRCTFIWSIDLPLNCHWHLWNGYVRMWYKCNVHTKHVKWITWTHLEAWI